MLFNSYDFLFAFLPVALGGFFWIAGRFGARAAMGWLFVASLGFYAFWNPLYLPLILGSIVFNYVLAGLLRPREDQTRRRRWLLVAGVGVNLGLLAYYKYAGFLKANLDLLLDAQIEFGPVLLPLAISFFTFQQIAYLVDAWRGEISGRGLLEYGLFVSFFPQLIAGPIVLHREMLPQLASARFGRPESRALAVGLAAVGIGLFKKVIIADSLAPYATAVFDHAESGASLAAAQAWTGALAYTFQLYFDFSGYSDMAIGLARLFGLRLALNFDSPYKATSLIDFWRRWHMTLSRFLRDYLYISLGGSRHGAARRYANLMLTMLLGGLWHGAGWSFVVWGGLHGAGLIVNHAFRRARSGNVSNSLGGGLLTFVFVVAAWVPFRAESLESAGRILTAMAGFGEGASAFLLADEPLVVPLLAATALLVWLAPNSQELLAGRGLAIETRASRRRAATPRWLRWQPSFGWALATAMLLALAITRLTGPSEFLYFQF